MLVKFFAFFPLQEECFYIKKVEFGSTSLHSISLYYSSLYRVSFLSYCSFFETKIDRFNLCFGRFSEFDLRFKSNFCLSKTHFFSLYRDFSVELFIKLYRIFSWKSFFWFEKNLPFNRKFFLCFLFNFISTKSLFLDERFCSLCFYDDLVVFLFNYVVNDLVCFRNFG